VDRTTKPCFAAANQLVTTITAVAYEAWLREGKESGKELSRFFVTRKGQGNVGPRRRRYDINISADHQMMHEIVTAPLSQFHHDLG
jgi:hypothetical protein